MELLKAEDFLGEDGKVHTPLKPDLLKSSEVPEFFSFQNLPDDIQSMSAFDIMLLFIPLTLWRHVVTETNRHFDNNPPKGQNGKRWKPVTLRDLMVWHGLLLAMTLQKNPSDYARYWDEETPDTFANEAVRATDYSRFMKQYRWEEIKRFMHFNDSSKDVARDHPDHDPLFKVRPVLRCLDKKFQKYGKLGVNCSIDEGMISGRLCTHLCRTVANKPDPTGFKLWCRCDPLNGYYHTIMVNTGDEVSRYREEFGVPQSEPLSEGEVVVYNMAKRMEPGQHLFIDRFFTSVRLAEKLLKEHIYVTGTCRRNSSKFPTALLEAELKKTEAGKMRGNCVTCRKAGTRLLAFAWKDSGLVLGLTTGKEPFGGKVNRKMMDGSHKIVPAPPCMSCYNIYIWEGSI